MVDFNSFTHLLANQLSFIYSLYIFMYLFMLNSIFYFCVCAAYSTSLSVFCCISCGMKRMGQYLKDLSLLFSPHKPAAFVLLAPSTRAGSFHLTLPVPSKAKSCLLWSFAICEDSRLLSHHLIFITQSKWLRFHFYSM